jgi:tRNA A37 threonylcarbamoyladenosine dehydratase
LLADNPEEYQLLPSFRVRIMPVVGTIPAMFGMVAATHVLNVLSDKVSKTTKKNFPIFFF